MKKQNHVNNRTVNRNKERECYEYDDRGQHLFACVCACLSLNCLSFCVHCHPCRSPDIEERSCTKWVLCRVTLRQWELQACSNSTARALESVPLAPRENLVLAESRDTPHRFLKQWVNTTAMAPAKARRPSNPKRRQFMHPLRDRTILTDGVVAQAGKSSSELR